MISFLSENYQWIFSGVGVLVLTLVIGAVFKKKRKENANSTNNINVVNNVNVGSTVTEKGNSDEPAKKLTRILFVDDKHKEFKIVSILKKSGWINTKSVEDIKDLDDPKVIEADIIFVDIHGVGTTLFEDQGLGLVSALRKKYTTTKKIVIYSADPNGNIFHKALREADDCLYKDAEPYQFISLIEEYSTSK